MEFLEYNHVTAEIKGTMVRFLVIYDSLCCYPNAGFSQDISSVFRFLGD